MKTQDLAIYHYSKCSKSVATLALLESLQLQPNIIYYLETPPSIATLEKLRQQLGFQSVRQLMRRQESIYQTLNLDEPQLTELELSQAIVAHPILLERPIVVYGQKAKIGRPPTAVLELFESNTMC